MKKEIKIVSLPRLKRFGIEPEDRYSRRQHQLMHVGKFTCFENRFAHHPDGGEAMYKQWFISQLAEYEDVYNQTKSLYQQYHFIKRDFVTIILLVDTETPPVHAKIIRKFIESAGAKL